MRRHDLQGDSHLMNQRIVRIPRRLITFVAAGGLATAGAAALATGWTASAPPGDAHQVWVCAYVGPQSDKVLKPGKNPLLVDEAVLQNGKFRGTQDDAVIVDNGDAQCPGGTPAPTTTTTVPTTEATTTVPTTTEATTTVPTTTEPTTTVPTTTEATTTVPTTTETTTTVPPTTQATTTVPTTTVPTTTVPTTTVPTTTVPTTTVPTTTVPTTTVPTTTVPTTTVPTTTVPTTTFPTTTVPTTTPGGNGANLTCSGQTGAITAVVRAERNRPRDAFRIVRNLFSVAEGNGANAVGPGGVTSAGFSGVLVIAEGKPTLGQAASGTGSGANT